MFALHETTRKHLCRLGFFALCLTPTLATAAWTASHYWPGHKGRTADALAAGLGVHVKLADWRHPRPGVVRSSGLSLSDLASAELLCDVSKFQQRRVGGSIALSASEITIDAGHLKRLVERANAWLAKLTPEVRDIKIDRLLVKAAGGPDFCMYKVEGRVDRDASGRARLKFTGHPEPQPHDTALIEFTLMPSDDGNSAAATRTLDAQHGGLPAALLDAVVPAVGRLGANARFTGLVQWTTSGGAQQGHLRGQVQNVDLEAVLPKRSTHTLHGMATAEFTDITWHGSKIDRMAGTLRAENALASRSLIEAFEERFACARPNDGAASSQNSDMIAIDQLAIGFQLDGNGLSFWGDCPASATAARRCLATSGLQPLLLDPPYYNYHPAVLLQAFAAPGATWIPASPEAISIAERLPMPAPAAVEPAAK